MTDLGGGVYEHDESLHEQHLAGTESPHNGVPTCPWCGITGNAHVVANPHGRWYCSCGSLFSGTDAEWRRLAKHRRQAAERRARTTPPPEQEAS